MPANPLYTGDPISAGGSLTTANANRDGATGTLLTAYTFRAAASGGKGGRLDAVYAVASSTSATAAGNIIIFIQGIIVREIATTAITASATVKGYTIPTSEGADTNGRLALNIVCAAGDVVKVLTTVTQNIAVRFEGGEF